MLGVGDGEAIPLEEGRKYLLGRGFNRHELTLAETLKPGSIGTIVSLDIFARRTGEESPVPDRTIVALLQNLEELRLLVEMYLRKFGGSRVAEETILDADGQSWPRGLKPNPRRPTSLNATIRKRVLEPNRDWFGKFYRLYGSEIRLPWRTYELGPTVTAISTNSIVVRTAR
ncbi:hypothetical protein IID23_04355 [Patescibacteria group bacterium]|nr:hypothetical protein [Patescibacteria group bacterium]